MSTDRPALLSFNRGEVSKHALTRVDVERLRLSAETQENWQAHVLGPMSLRPGLGLVGRIHNDNRCKLIPFIFDNDDSALVEITDGKLRVWNIVGDGEELVTRAAVASVVTNGDFSSAVGWDLTETGSGAVAEIANDVLTLASPATGGLARARGSVNVAVDERPIEHAFRIVVLRGPVTFRCGTTVGGDELIEETILGTGVHSLSWRLGSSGAVAFFEFETISATRKIVDSITIEAAGPMELPIAWTENHQPFLRTDQEGDIIFSACRGLQQRKIERRATASWSFVLYETSDGPFQPPNLSDITLTPSVLTGNGTLTANRKLFKTGHVGSLFRLFSSGQTVTATLSAQNTFTEAIRVTGVEATRIFSYLFSGTWTGTLTLQRSFDSATAGFADVANFSSNTGANFNDSLANSIIWYRVGFKTGNYTDGSANITLSYAGGGEAGVCRVTAVQSTTVADVEILKPFSSLTASDNWSFADWSNVAGWPDAVRFHDGRIFWAARGRGWGSVSDGFYSFDEEVAGDSGPINRSIGSGAGVINWLLSLSRLIAGRPGEEVSVRSSSLDEGLTPTEFSGKACSTQGSDIVAAVKVDNFGVFVEKSGRRVYELALSVEAQDYRARDLTRLNTDIGKPGFVDAFVQRQPDTQLHFVRKDGQAAILLYDREDEVEGWFRTVTPGAGGVIECGAVLPGRLEDRVYYAVKRTIGGQTRRYLEKFARRDQCLGQPEGRLADSHVMYSGAPTTTIGNLSHLEGEEVVVWGWNTIEPFKALLPDDTEVTVGRDLGTFTVTGGQITGLPAEVTDACVGLYYEARFKSSKLAYAALRGSPLTQKKKLDKIGLILTDTHHKGLLYGQSFDPEAMDELPEVEEGADVEDDTVWPELDAPMTALPGDWDTDARLCLVAQAPRPCTVCAAVVKITTNE